MLLCSYKSNTTNKRARKEKKKKNTCISLQEAGRPATAGAATLAVQLAEIKRRLSALLQGTSTALRTQQGPAEIWRRSRAAVWGSRVKNTKCTHGCCRWSPARCPSWAGCRPAWRRPSPPCPAAAWPSGAARWWADPSRPAGPVAAAGCSPSPPWPGAEVQAQRVTRRERDGFATKCRGLAAGRQIAFLKLNHIQVWMVQGVTPPSPYDSPDWLWQNTRDLWVQEKAGVYIIVS